MLVKWWWWLIQWLLIGELMVMIDPATADWGSDGDDWSSDCWLGNWWWWLIQRLLIGEFMVVSNPSSYWWWWFDNDERCSNGGCEVINQYAVWDGSARYKKNTTSNYAWSLSELNPTLEKDIILNLASTIKNTYLL